MTTAPAAGASAGPGSKTDAVSLFHDPGAWVDMRSWHEQVAELRRTQPIVPVDDPAHEHYWVLTRHGDVVDVERQHELWHNTARSALMPDADWDRAMGLGVPEPRSLVHLDGTEHHQHRRVANDWFKPAATQRWRARIEEIADEFMAKMRDLDGACHFARDVAQPYTLRVIMEIYGVPEQDEALMLELTQGLFGASDPEFTGEVDGCPMSDEHRLWYYIIVATAGHDTTSFALTGGLQALIEQREQFAALQRDPDLVVNAAEEIIRWTSPVRHMMRYAQDDTEVGGVAMPAGSRVLLSYPSANRDEAVFEHSMEFDISRPDADKLISFGLGPHFCLGAHFARREIRTMMGKLAAQLGSIELASEPENAEAHFVSGAKHLPIEYRFR